MQRFFSNRQENYCNHGPIVCAYVQKTPLCPILLRSWKRNRSMFHSIYEKNTLQRVYLTDLSKNQSPNPLHTPLNALSLSNTYRYPSLCSVSKQTDYQECLLFQQEISQEVQHTLWLQLHPRIEFYSRNTYTEHLLWSLKILLT